MRLVLLGTGEPEVTLSRSGPSQIIETANRPILIDCGGGTTTQLFRAGIPPETVKDLLVTHLHLDHFAGLTQFVFAGWHRGRRELRVWGPRAFGEIIRRLFHEVYSCLLYTSDAADE